jgi:3-oxoacyl-[acyl-carrier protein] reductase
MTTNPPLNFPHGMLAGTFRPRPHHSPTNPTPGQTAIITGAAQGIGAETALILAREGANIVIADLDAGTLLYAPTSA